METGKGIFSADYRDDRVYLGGKNYPLGYFTVDLLNQYYENDTVARISVMRTYMERTERTLRLGYLDERDLQKAGDEILYILKFLPNIQPFQMLDIEEERSRIQALFTEENAYSLMNHFRIRGDMAKMDAAQVIYNIMPRSYDQETYASCESLLGEILRTLRFYAALGNDFTTAFHGFRKFVERLDEAERFDEEHLLPIAMEVFGPRVFPAALEYVAIKKVSRSKGTTVARRLHFDNYLSFILTDFFEALHRGHYPRRCGVCKQYFLMTSARRQAYCDGMAPYELRGKRTTCRKYAAAMGRRELAENDPIKDLYNRRRSVIRTEKNRGTITPEFAAVAYKLAKEHKFRALQDEVYAATQYSPDMEREQLYRDAEKLIK